MCLLCGKVTPFNLEPICPECWAKAIPINGLICKKCGLPLGPMHRSGLDHSYLCAGCRQNKWGFDLARAGYIFAGPVRDAIHKMKYQRHFKLGVCLGRKMLEVLQDASYNGNADSDLIVPVPLSHDRFREREFNHAFVLARQIGKSLNIAVDPLALERTTGSKPQVGLSTRERWSNVRGTFKLKVPGSVDKRDIILVDDVFTTGATADECARELKKAGAIRVSVLTLARTL